MPENVMLPSFSRMFFAALALFALSGCVPANQQVGLCTYTGGCASNEDPTAYTSPSYAGNKVGLCSYLGGCMEDEEGGAAAPAKKSDSGVGGDVDN